MRRRDSVPASGAQLIRDLESTRDETLGYFSLEFVHSVTGVRTLSDEFEKVAAHNEHHLEQIRLALRAVI